nr:hypothetical protein [uncultured Pedobacter sp.]
MNYMHYNERGWLKSSTGGEFSIQLDYQENGGGQYNGNISRQFCVLGFFLINSVTRPGNWFAGRKEDFSIKNECFNETS